MAVGLIVMLITTKGFTVPSKTYEEDDANENFKVICVEYACAAASMEHYDTELKIMNNLYCNVLSTDETITIWQAN